MSPDELRMSEESPPAIVHGAASADEAAAVHQALTRPRVLADLARWRRQRRAVLDQMLRRASPDV
jgi:hypothetical protein